MRARDGRWWRRALAALTLCAWSAIALAEATEMSSAEARRQLDSGVRHGLLFEASKGERKAWVYGTLHVGKPDVLPIDKEVVAAMTKARGLAVEVDVTDSARMQAAVQKYAFYPEGHSLADDLAPADLARVESWLAARGVSHDQALRMRPWMLGATLTIVEAQRLGLTPSMGADVLLIGMARTMSKPVLEIETIEEQFKAMAAGTREEQAADLLDGVEGLRSGEANADLRTLVDAWIAADQKRLIAALDKIAADPRPANRRAYESVLLARNPTIAQRIEALSADGPIVAAVGALHLVGVHSVIEELEHRGWTVARR